MTGWVRLSTEQVIGIHDEIWPCPVRDWTVLHGAVEKPWTSYAEVEMYPRLIDKMAALLQGLARNQAFMDGNKRTAFHACLLLGRVNGVGIELPYDEHAASFVESVARGDVEHAEVVAWLARRARLA